MSLSAALLLAAAAAAPVNDAEPSHGVVLAEARVSVRILPAAMVRQASGFEPASETAPRPQLSRRGRTILVEFQ